MGQGISAATAPRRVEYPIDHCMNEKWWYERAYGLRQRERLRARFRRLLDRLAHLLRPAIVGLHGGVSCIRTGDCRRVRDGATAMAD